MNKDKKNLPALNSSLIPLPSSLLSAMTYELEYFKEFQDDPASFSDEDFRTKVLEWMIFIEECGDHFDFEDEQWDEVADRFFDELDARFPRTFKLEADFVSLKLRLTAALEPSDANVFIKILRELCDFIKRYQVEFQFSRHYLARTEQQLKEIEQMKAKIIANEYVLKGLEYEHQQSVIALDEALARYYEQTGKIPVRTALRAKKRPNGN